MANIFTWNAQDIDLKECIKLKTNCQQMDNMTLQFNIYDYDVPVDLTNFNVTFVAKKPDGNIYGQAENITKVGKLLTINCSNQLTTTTGRTVGILEIIDNDGNRKGSYFIVLNVFGIVNSDDRVVSRNFVDILEKFDEDVAIAMSLSTSFKTDIIEAQTIAEDFATIIPEARTVNTQLNTTLNTAIPLETKLANDITTGTSLSTKLESNITSANTVKSELVLGSASANIDKDVLITTIADADDKLQEFKDYDTTEIVPKTNLMLNEMYCNKELLSINHGLNGYPIVKMTYTQYGAGIGGAGDFPAGADSDCNLMRNNIIYDDNNNITILVPQNYYIALPLVNKLNDYKYIVTFTNSTKSILIELIKGSISEDILNINKAISDLNYQDAQGTDNEITLTINKTLTNGYSLTFIAKENNNGNPTTINGKHLYKPNTTTSPTLIGGKAYTIWYNSSSDCFFIKASAVGDADVLNVLATKKFSNDEDTELIGLMPNNGALNSTITTAGGTFAIPLGYTSGGVITAPSLANVTSEGTVTNNNQLLNGYKCISNGIVYTGNIPSKTAQSYKPITTNQVITAGQYISENQIILGYSDLVSENIVKDKVIGDVIGSATVSSLGGKHFATGTTTSSTSVNANFDKDINGSRVSNSGTYEVLSVSVLGFTPSVVIAHSYYNYNGGNYETYQSIYRDGKCTLATFQGVGYATATDFLYVDSVPNGFYLPTSKYNSSYSWVAYE